jgi:uncharacterized protein (DUF2237 family)
MASILNKPLEICSTNPMTGYYRDGYCNNYPDDSGTHVVCAELTDDFLKFTKSRGNNLITPRQGFPGLKQGNRWCVCASRWNEAYRANKAPPVVLGATHKSALKFNNLKTFRKLSKTRRLTRRSNRFKNLK